MDWTVPSTRTGTGPPPAKIEAMPTRSLPPVVRTCLGGLALLAAACWLGPPLLGIDPQAPDWTALSVPPGTPGHWFGTDAIGRDVLARTLAGGRLSLAIGALASVVALGIGLGYGAVAGLAGGRTERVLLRVLDVFSALPFLLVVILLLTLFERSLGLLLAAIGGYVWLDLALVATLAAFQFLGDGLRDWLDVRGEGEPAA